MTRCGLCGITALLIGSLSVSCATFSRTVEARGPDEVRASLISRSHVWRPTEISLIDFQRGPQGPGAFAFHETLWCDYLDKKLDGASPKFACALNKDDELKVKYGGNNGEVYGEVLASRLLWALGFGADRMYPVNVICRKCPDQFNGIERSNDESRFDPATVERKMDGKELTPGGKAGWSWAELEKVDPEAGGAPRAQREALTLLAVFMQHSDSKPQQNRMICLSDRAGDSADACDRPFLMISDVGLTFGRASFMNVNDVSGVNLNAWRETPLWKGAAGCMGNLPKSFSGGLDYPVVSEQGRRFLADLMNQLSDRQIRDLFAAGRVQLRLRTPGKGDSGFATIDEWVSAFKDKRRELVERRCS